jgi:hypothetical protein
VKGCDGRHDRAYHLELKRGDSLFPTTPQSNRNSYVGVLLASYRDAPKA